MPCMLASAGHFARHVYYCVRCIEKIVCTVYFFEFKASQCSKTSTHPNSVPCVLACTKVNISTQVHTSTQEYTGVHRVNIENTYR